jgi:hypothetical protein
LGAVSEAGLGPFWPIALAVIARFGGLGCCCRRCFDLLRLVDWFGGWLGGWGLVSWPLVVSVVLGQVAEV